MKFDISVTFIGSNANKTTLLIQKKIIKVDNLDYFIL